jgi:hypothetical protein
LEEASKGEGGEFGGHGVAFLEKPLNTPTRPTKQSTPSM